MKPGYRQRPSGLASCRRQSVVGRRIRRSIDVGANVGMKPSEQVYSQIVEREQFRNTTQNDEGGDGEVHHATAVRQL